MRTTVRFFIGVVVLPAGCTPAERGPALLGHIAPADPDAEQVRGVREAFSGPDSPKSLNVLHAEVDGDERVAAGQAHRLLATADPAGLIGGFSPGEARAIARAADGRVAVVCLSGIAEDVRGAFALNIDPAERGRCLALYASELDPPARSAGVALDPGVPGAEEAAGAFTSQFLKVQGNSVRQVRPGEPGPPLGELDVLAVTRWPPSVSFAPGEKSPRILYLGPEAERPNVEGVYIATAFIADAGGEGVRPFVEAYRERHSAEPGVEAALAYDGVRIFARAAESASGPVAELPGEILKALRAGEPFPCLNGELRFLPSGRCRRTVLIGELRGGRPHRVAAYPPELNR